MNTIILTGRLTRDPELKFGQSGKAYSRFSLAVDRAFSKDEVDFINCVAFGKTAELIGEYLRKGKKAGVTGRLQMNRYEFNGEKRTSYDVIVDTVEFLEPKNSSGSYNGPDPYEPYEPEYSAPKPTQSRAAEPDFHSVPDNDVSETEDDDEFPF
ncbi:Single-stranded DNA-binding protein [Fusobacterium sp. DD29]|uniref:single-stranded DNA-binding protein n=1 Tax=unclassified Fusobacterium TaxID=2648384 RepID=UPI001B8CF528|nr:MULTISPECIES: single-stranded DNA-binding protein [unclassified Fusobacterium]MBR8700428.1 Single-stranded DNA-binding protein [Fusobacterium sp. DD45]MBR8710177.1 Single-stranded DNA-binding protein [Fusobacterium sp. DD28]MBR8748734.1 Single-stranded DNA-binding protein [Fusobacterium sp. DD29]MBR8750722.1 Single-stranded DNA-binding protein [Fusobacterium sp. DD26]MBR8761001.1 Single-stranded DNA-binding protein [Fusobacterium sp. DD25]